MNSRAAFVVFVSVGVLGLLAACGGGGAPGAEGAAATVSSSPSAAVPSNPDTSSPASPASAAAVAPSPGTTLATVQGGGRVNVVSNWQGQGFTVVDSGTDNSGDASTLQAYDAAGDALAEIPAGSFTGECGAADVVTPRGRLLLAEKIIHRDAQGIQSATDTLTLTAYDAATGSRVWTSTLIRDSTSGVSCTAYDGYLGSRNAADPTFTVTFDGHWGVFQPDDRYDLSHSIAIDLSTGRLYPRPGLYGALGDWVTVAKMSDTPSSPESLTLTTPGSWPTFGTLTLGDSGMLQKLPGPFDLALATPGAQFPTNNVADPTAAAITPDGRTLIGVEGNSDQGANVATVAYALPAMKKLWSVPTAQYDSPSMEGINDSVVVLASGEDGGSTTLLTALSTQTAAKVWQQHIQTTASVCAMTSTQLVVLANGQLASLSAADGHQITYHTDQSQDVSGQPDCPAVLAGGVSGLGLQGSAVVQLATP